MLKKELNTKQELLAEMLRESLTRSEFEELSTKIVEYIKLIKENNLKELKNIKDGLDSIMSANTKQAEDRFEILKKEINNLLLGHASENKNSLEAKIKEIDERLEMVKDGKDADEEIIVEKVLSKIELPEIKGIESDLPKMGAPIRDALELLQGKDRLSVEAISGLYEYIKNVIKANTPKQAVGGLRPAGTGIETPLGDVNGTNKAYTVNFVPEFITLNGQAIYSGYGYALSSVAGVLTITLENAPQISDIIRSHYKEL